MTEHTYPDGYGPGRHWATDAAWAILDSLPPSALDGEKRAWLCGLIAGALVKASETGPIASGALAELPKWRS